MGYNEFAATNDIIMVYPDSKCWGYSGTVTDDKAFTRDGMMPKTIMSMVDRVTSSGPEESECSLLRDGSDVNAPWTTSEIVPEPRWECEVEQWHGVWFLVPVIV